jgi:hypothetical protein
MEFKRGTLRSRAHAYLDVIGISRGFLKKTARVVQTLRAIQAKKSPDRFSAIRALDGTGAHRAPSINLPRRLLPASS